MVKYDRTARVNRWAYYGLHGLDVSFLYNRRPLWDIVASTLLLGGALLSSTTLIPMYRRLKRHGRRIWEGAGGRRRPVPRTEPVPQMTMSDANISKTNF